MTQVINKKSKFNPTVSELYKDAIVNDDLNLTSTGALLAYSGEKTGRCPKDKRIVIDDKTKNIWWGNVNMPISPVLFDYYKQYAVNYLNSHKQIYTIDAYAGWDLENRIKIRLYCTSAYHALFMLDLLIPAEEKFLVPDFIIYDVGELNLSNATDILKDNNIKDKNLKNTLVGLNFTSMEMLVYGTKYAGEIKKGIFSLMMYLMPLKNHLPLHSSVNIGENNLCFFFGLSGTGKTTLSADSVRKLIGDDEHVWTDKCIFNIEGGCYAKCINLKEESEPEIYKAIKYGAVLENVTTNKNFDVNYDDDSITENTRCAYPLKFISNAIIPAISKLSPNNIILLTCDAFGILPPVAKLNADQAIYFFINGYTSKIPGTEVGINEPTATFSACFGEPFLVWNPLQYGQLLKEKILLHKPNIWMLNTGWINGPYGVGKRISIKDTKNILNKIHDGSLLEQKFIKYPVFNFDIPINCPGISGEVLDPRLAWADQNIYLEKLTNLHKTFVTNYNKYKII